MSRNCAGVRKAFSSRRSESGGGKCTSRTAVHRSGSLSRCAKMSRAGCLPGGQRFQHAVRQNAQNARGDLARGLVDGHDAAGVQRGFAVVVLPGEDLELRVQHGELAGVGIELDFAEQRHPHALARRRWRGSRRGTICRRGWRARRRRSALRNSPRLRRRKPETSRERTSAMTVAISPGASWAMVFMLLRSS